MKKSITLTVISFLLVCSSFAQTTSNDKPTTVLETMYIMPKRGMEDKFEAAIKAHDTKFHPDGKYAASLRKVEYGEKAGWYVWVFGPTTYSAIDTRPTKESGHDADWSATVDPLVETYGDTRLSELDENLTYGFDALKASKYREVWMVDLKRGEYYRFKALAEKLKKAYEALGTGSFVVYNNVIHTTNGADVALVWGFNTYDEWSKDMGAMKAYEKLYGAGSWQDMFKEWNEIVVDYNVEIRSLVK
jgi:hypothetical protein